MNKKNLMRQQHSNSLSLAILCAVTLCITGETVATIMCLGLTLFFALLLIGR